MRQVSQQGFTLIELSIVLIIIGLIVGGVLVGQNLIAAAGVRATISQIEKYNTAARTFYGKYGYLPGDIRDPDATNFGFLSRGQYAGEGDGNGVLEGVQANAAGNDFGASQRAGETVMFWVDLSRAGLIDGTFNIATPNTPIISDVTGAALNGWFPQAKLGNGNFIYIFSGGIGCCGAAGSGNGVNYFGLSAVTSNGAGCGQCMNSVTSIPVIQASSIDTKIDDGLPQSGNVTAMFVNRTVSWANGAGNNYIGANPGQAAWNDILSCYGNNNTTATQQYAVGAQAKGGVNPNCALSFQFQ